MHIHIGPYTNFNKRTKKTPKRKIKIKLDRWDTWNLDSTLAMIILPALKQLKNQKHGAPNTDDEDVPKKLRSTSAPKKKNDWDTDKNWFKRWDWILDEMIWAFEQYNTDWEKQYHSGKVDFELVPTKETKDLPKNKQMFEMVKGKKHTHQFDKEGYQNHSAKIQNGFRLFAKYYMCLWT